MLLLSMLYLESIGLWLCFCRSKGLFFEQNKNLSVWWSFVVDMEGRNFPDLTCLSNAYSPSQNLKEQCSIDFYPLRQRISLESFPLTRSVGSRILKQEENVYFSELVERGLKWGILHHGHMHVFELAASVWAYEDNSVSATTLPLFATLVLPVTYCTCTVFDWVVSLHKRG